ncbi:MAG TPA: hypothetical protein DEB39_01495 [Planctomycetaceae bacterium]|nr:hypothetical protein [Planctomycetaceae bacterium]
MPKPVAFSGRPIVYHPGGVSSGGQARESSASGHLNGFQHTKAGRAVYPGSLPRRKSNFSAGPRGRTAPTDFHATTFHAAFLLSPRRFSTW